ncbi:hypothetical protein DH2020_039438 [Rehmannia glutinosa]|uniref:Reverse transcriptase Ty1/copia-type domain-containing protein n=1 Tax=Rehmannia glutinosa TaxID=99300 RepID=A0ABR0UXP9_REHGL
MLQTRTSLYIKMDVKSAFLNGLLEEEVYVEQPPGFEEKTIGHKVYKFKKALYGLKQEPRAWYDTLSQFLTHNRFTKGFIRGKVDTTLFVFEKGQDCLLVQIYVDDIMFGATNDSLCKKFSKLMQGEFEMSMMGELNFFLGLQIKQCQEGIYISQSKYTKELLKKFGIEEGRTVSTPMATNVKIDKDEKGKSVDESKYRGMIGSLLYLTASRPDILHAVCLCARFQSNPKESHMSAVKRIFRYLKGTIQYGLFYPKNENEGGFKLVGHSDSDYARCRVDKKSTSGTCQMLGNRLVSWFSKKQNSIATSTAEAEYIDMGSCCAKVLWMRQQLRDYDIEETEIPIMCDNTSAIAITQNPVLHSRTKHIDFRYHFIRDHVEWKYITLEYISTSEAVNDIFTKPLCESRFEELKNELGLIKLS